MALTLNFEGHMWNLLYLSQKCSDCHETKVKHIDWTRGIKCDHWVWPWPWPWPWIFKVKYGICLKCNYQFDRHHDLDLWIFKFKCDLDLWPHMVLAIDSCIFEWEGRLTLNKGWEWAIHDHDRDHLVTKVRCTDLFQIVIRVTSDVGVPSTRLVETKRTYFICK